MPNRLPLAALLLGLAIAMPPGGGLAQTAGTAPASRLDSIIAGGVLRTLERPPRASHGNAPYAIYNIGNHEAVSLDAFIGLLEALLGRRALRNERPMQPGDVKATYASIERLQRDTGFAPSTPLADGLARFVDWYRRYYPAP